MTAPYEVMLDDLAAALGWSLDIRSTSVSVFTNRYPGHLTIVDRTGDDVVDAITAMTRAAQEGHR